MAIDVKKLDEKIRKYKMLREIAEDPEMAEMLSEVMVGNGVKPHAAIAVAPEGDGGRLFYAEKAIRSFLPNVLFTGKDVTTKMQELGYKFTAKDPSVSTYGALVLLLEREIIEVGEKGAPGKSAKYRLKL
jgi:hypothetical protein